MTVTSIAQGCFDVTKGLRKCQGVGVYFLLCLLSYQRALVIHMPSAASKRDTQPGKIKISHISKLFVQIKRIITNIILGDSRIYATETAFLESFSPCRTEPQLPVKSPPSWLHTRSHRFIIQKYLYSCQVQRAESAKGTQMTPLPLTTP